MTTRKVRQNKVRQNRNRLLANRIIVAVLVLAVVAAIYGLAKVARPITLTPAKAAPSAGSLSVTSASLGCPAPGSGKPTGGGIAIASVPLSTAAGHETFTRLAPDSPGTRVGSAARLGQLTVESIPAGPSAARKTGTGTAKKRGTAKKSAAGHSMAGGLVPTNPGKGGLIVSASGASAQGIDVEQLSPSGQPTARCVPAGSDFWFVGPGSVSLHSYLYLLNVGSMPADAALSVQTDGGPLLGPADSGIVVPPHAMVVQTLDKLLHSARAIALHVMTSTGTVVAAVRQTTSTGKAGQWLPAAAEPATTQILPGLPAMAGTRELYVTVPGSAPAQVKVTVITARGTYQPTGGTGISLLQHQTTGVPIPSLSGLPGAVEVSANVPITAAVELPGGQNGSPGSFLVGSGPVVGQGVVAASSAGRNGATDLELSAPGAAASVRIVRAPPGAPLTGQSGQVVHIPAKSSVQVRLSLPKRLAKIPLLGFVVTPLPGSGPVYAGRVALIRGAVQTVLPVVSSPARIRLSPVRQSLLAVLGSG